MYNPSAPYKPIVPSMTFEFPIFSNTESGWWEYTKKEDKNKDCEINIVIYQNNGDGTLSTLKTHILNRELYVFSILDVKNHLSALLHVPVTYIVLKLDDNILKNDFSVCNYYGSTLHCYIPDISKEKRTALSSTKLKSGLVVSGICTNESCMLFGERIKRSLGLGAFYYSTPPSFRCISQYCNKLIVSDQFGFYSCLWIVKKEDISVNNDAWDARLQYFNWSDFATLGADFTTPTSLIIKTMVRREKCYECLQDASRVLCNFCNPVKSVTAIYLEHGDTCAICLESLCDCELETLKCGHVFHYKCAEDYKKISNKCAFCRK